MAKLCHPAKSVIDQFLKGKENEKCFCFSLALSACKKKSHQTRIWRQEGNEPRDKP
jgi:hypothetical protein